MNIFHEAAEIVSLKISVFAFCCSTLDVLDPTGVEKNSFTKLFAPIPTEFCFTTSYSSSYVHGKDAWGQYWGNAPDDYETARECRVLALCFAAAMRDAGDL